MSWDNLVSVVNRTKAKAHIYEHHHLDQRCFKEKRPLKISINIRDIQLKKAQIKTRITL